MEEKALLSVCPAYSPDSDLERFDKRQTPRAGAGRINRLPAIFKATLSTAAAIAKENVPPMISNRLNLKSVARSLPNQLFR